MEKLKFIGKKHSPRDPVDSLLETLMLWSVRVETDGTESNIPKTGPIVIGFMPHSGWLELFAISHLVRKIRGEPVVWITKEENRSGLPKSLLGNRLFIFVDRGNPGPNAVRIPGQVLKNRMGAVGSAFEGTRRGNPDDPNDLRSLGEAKPGLVHIAQFYDVPIIPVATVGAEQFLPLPEELKKEEGIMGILRALLKGAAAKAEDKPIIHLRFAAPFTVPSEGRRGIRSSKWSAIQTDRLVRDIVVPLIREIDPHYPLGFYSEARR